MGVRFAFKTPSSHSETSKTLNSSDSTHSSIVIFEAGAITLVMLNSYGMPVSIKHVAEIILRFSYFVLLTMGTTGP